MKPLIGITGNRHSFSTKLPGPALIGVNLSDDYGQGVEMAGGLPVAIPFLADMNTADELAERIDGLLLAGGEDVSPLLYGEEPRKGLGDVIPERDELEFALIQAMRKRHKPILGICRGIQVLNVAYGGTLYQDLVREWKGTVVHSQRARRSHLSHSVQIDPESRLFHLLGENEKVTCNSFHHQAIKDLGRSLAAVAWDDEGLIEAVEAKGEDFVVGVQWHPENLWRPYPVFLGLFRGLVQAAIQRQVHPRKN
ncbi:gamma-glutamyl-gamma-aminobutyrate hydrolase family protein [Alicyclobacillus tolerans]|uniref:gamma-glutamyl-gamma-aminobutyrate hydrolase family protein n=1 Tax=Alicyclobacillus tolerans TaxID=90970 RepID=UPI001F37573E|nr:gamma-glutamyl-gamma-aminobutyrate hydrolase family protein [Alicyclobacillus tolerans]MCF8566364.1 gamma-glutamyl-gamma-aminobutyrate hydrolase family protein [Alicyclobacillus tolerans]